MQINEIFCFSLVYDDCNMLGNTIIDYWNRNMPRVDVDTMMDFDKIGNVVSELHQLSFRQVAAVRLKLVVDGTGERVD